MAALATQRPSRSKRKVDRKEEYQHLVPVYPERPKSNSPSHNMKYYILKEQPKEYICERGCVHVYVPTEKPRALVEKLSPVQNKSSFDKLTKTVSNPLRPSKQYELQNEMSFTTASPIPPKFALSGGKLETRSPVRQDQSPVRDPRDKSPLRYEYNKNARVWDRLYPYRQSPVDANVPDKNAKVKMNWKNYHRLDVIHSFMDELEYEYPSLCTVGLIGESLEGRPMKLLKISNGNADNVAVWLDAGIHAREWIGPAVNTFIANYIARNFDKLPVWCTNKDWYFLPVANPDGYEYSHTTARMWRKNRAYHNGKCVGVDLNRNFSFGWGGKGSSDDPNHCFYRGPGPFSEPESCALRNVLQYAKLPFKVYITLHAFGEVIIFPFACSNDLSPDYIRLLNGAAVMSRAIYETNGTIYRVGISKDMMYRASGTSNDWCYGSVGIPYCYLIELRSKKHRFKAPQEEIEETGNEILNCVMALMEFVDKYPIEPRRQEFQQKDWMH